MLRIFLVFICLVCTQVMPAEAKRVALVIGNAKYATVGVLFTPQRDVPLIEKALHESGFDEVDVHMDLDKEAMTDALDAFSDKASNAEVALIYFAGHGVEINNTNYLVPIDAKLQKASKADYEAIDLALVRKSVFGASKLRMVVLDACRNNPFPLEAKDGSRASRKIGLSGVQLGVNELVAFSAQKGVVADDGPPNGNSPFAAAFAKWLVEPGLEIRFVMGNVRDEVMNNTGTTKDRDGSQIPYLENTLGGEQIFFKPAIAMPAPAPETSLQEEQIAADFELARTLNSQTGWESFLIRHANAKGMRADVAKREWEKFALLNVPPKPPEPECAGVVTTVQGESRCLQPGDTFTDCVDCPEMVVVPAGSFIMGSPKDGNWNWDETLQHKVTFGQSFGVGKFEVKRGQFAEFVRETNYTTGSTCWILNVKEWKDTTGKSWRDTGYTQSDDHPVACVSWDDAQAYLKWLSKKSGVGYRLLTEAEWEYATRATTTTQFFTGHAITTAQANFNNEKQATTVVGTYDANKFGLFDMAGNLWEWTEDCYEDSYKKADPTGKATKGNSCERVVRGGGWGSIPEDLRSANRSMDAAVNHYYYLGFRLARTF